MDKVDYHVTQNSGTSISRDTEVSNLTDSLFPFQAAAPPFPEIKSTHSLVAKYVTKDKWSKLGGLKTKTSGFTLGQVREIKRNISHFSVFIDL